MLRAIRSLADGTVNRPELEEAAAANNLGPLRDFVIAGGSVEKVRNDNRGTLLHVAAFEGSNEVLAMLLREVELVKLIDGRNRSKRTALHLAAATGSPESVRRLAAAGAGVQLQDEWACTPLHLAVKFGNAEAARELLEMGADPAIVDKNRMTARAYALGSQVPSMITLFKELEEAEAFCPRHQSKGSIGCAAKEAVAVSRPRSDVASIDASPCINAFGHDATLYGFTGAEAPPPTSLKSDPVVGEPFSFVMIGDQGLANVGSSNRQGGTAAGSPTPLVVGRPMPNKPDVTVFLGLSGTVVGKASTG